jgi:hypothetical protein
MSAAHGSAARTPGSRCPGCSAAVDGRAGCQALWDRFSARAVEDLDYAKVHDLAFDAYCMQHVDSYCRSAKSYAAHLTRLCCGLEHDGDPAVYSAIRRWLDGPSPVDRPETLDGLGELTIADVTGPDIASSVHAWAERVWAAYEPQQGLARTWIAAALGR